MIPLSDDNADSAQARELIPQLEELGVHRLVDVSGVAPTFRGDYRATARAARQINQMKCIAVRSFKPAATYRRKDRL